MTIKELYQKMRDEIAQVAAGVRVQEYGPTQQGGKTIRGNHVEVCIPVEQSLVPEAFERIFKIINERLCKVTWDKTIEVKEISGAYNGTFYELNFDNDNIETETGV